MADYADHSSKTQTLPSGLVLAYHPIAWWCDKIKEKSFLGLCKVNNCYISILREKEKFKIYFLVLRGFPGGWQSSHSWINL